MLFDGVLAVFEASVNGTPAAVSVATEALLDVVLKYLAAVLVALEPMHAAVSVLTSGRASLLAAAEPQCACVQVSDLQQVMGVNDCVCIKRGLVSLSHVTGHLNTRGASLQSLCTGCALRVSMRPAH